METKIQVTNSFKLELSGNWSSADINEINIGDISGGNLEVNEVSSGRRWNNNHKKCGYNSNQSYNSNNWYNYQNQDKKSGNKWECKERDCKIILVQESSHFVPAKFRESFFKQFDLAMQLRKEELKKQGKVEAEVSEVTEESVISTFGVTKDYMLEAAKILEAEGNIKNLGDPSAWLPNLYGPANCGKNVDQVTKMFSLFKQVVPKVPNSKLMLVAWYFLLFLIQVHK